MINPSDRLSTVNEYFFSKKLKELDVLRLSGTDVINLGVGSPDMLPPKSSINALREYSTKSDSHGYQSYTGLAQFRQAIADFYQRHYDVILEANEEVLPMMGSKEAIMHISLAYLNPGDQVLIPALGYPTYSSVTKIVQAEPLFYPLIESKKWNPDWEYLENLDYDKIKIIWINYPHMPTGTQGSEEILDRFIDLAIRKNLLLCHDNPYGFILNNTPRSIFNRPRAKKIAIELNSLSKTFNMAGWRVGWVCGADEYLKNILKVKSNMDSGMFKPIQLGAIAALNESNQWLEENNAEYAQRQKIAFEILDACGAVFSLDQSGMFVWGKISQESGSFTDELLSDHGVFITPGFIFGEAGKNYIRISLCIKQERLIEALNRLRGSGI